MSLRALRSAIPIMAVAALYFAPIARGDQMGWHSEAPIGPLGVPTSIGKIGDIEFWAPNRGALITAGITGVSPAGVYLYDGVGWHLYSTVCGGQEGRIAWAGPTEFWTVSSYAAPPEGTNDDPNARTLCHFSNGEVVKSYAPVLGSPQAYPKMKAAACAGPSDCWFAGEPMKETSPNPGSFHLAWDGSSLTPVPSLLDPQPAIEDLPGTVTDLDFLGGSLFEAASEAPFLREVNRATPAVFSPVPVPSSTAGPFRLAGDPGQLWAVAEDGNSALRNIGTGFESIPLSEGIGTVLAAGSEPNSAAVWVAVPRPGDPRPDANVRLVSASGAISEMVSLPGPGEGLEFKGPATKIVCPSAGQCWLATEQGWLFHLGGPLPEDTDPAMHQLITFRPADESTRTLPPPGLPEDNSGEREPGRNLGKEILEQIPERKKRPNLVKQVKQKLLGKRTLQLSFVLTATAHVQLLAMVHKKVVAKTKRMTLKKGSHRIHLKLDPEHWPTGLDFEVHPAAGKSK
jgi:hypothetical protein